jgi:hypothetical protein
MKPPEVAQPRAAAQERPPAMQSTTCTMTTRTMTSSKTPEPAAPWTIESWKMLRRSMLRRAMPLCTLLLTAALALSPVVAQATFEGNMIGPPDGSAASTGATAATAGDAEPKDADPCGVPAEIAPAQEPVPGFAGLFKDAPRPLTIVVLGSLSAGTSPSVRAVAGFPTRLQALLTREFEARDMDLPLKVEMVGKTGALTGELAGLIRREVLPRNPALVIWQVGRADARQSNSPHRFSQSLKDGLDILQQQRIPTILADIQFHPQFEALYRTDDYRNYVRWVAGKRDLPLLRRYEMIEHWALAGSIDLDSGDEADQQAAYAFIQECLAFQATRMILGAGGLEPR